MKRTDTNFTYVRDGLPLPCRLYAFCVPNKNYTFLESRCSLYFVLFSTPIPILPILLPSKVFCLNKCSVNTQKMMDSCNLILEKKLVALLV